MITRDFANNEIPKASIEPCYCYSIGAGFIPPGLFKIGNKNIAPYLQKMYKRYQNINFPETWGMELHPLIFKKGDSIDLDNYSAVSLLQSIFKIWETVITNIISPIVNQIAKEKQ